MKRFIILFTMLFREGEKDYWLTYQKEYFDKKVKTLKEGSMVTVITMLIGGVFQGDSKDWIFLVIDDDYQV